MNKIEIIKMIIDQDVKSAYAWYLLGVEYREQSMYTEGILALSKALVYSNDDLKENILEEMAEIPELTDDDMDNDNDEKAFGNIHNEEDYRYDHRINWNGTIDNQNDYRTDKVIPLRVIHGGKSYKR